MVMLDIGDVIDEEDIVVKNDVDGLVGVDCVDEVEVIDRGDDV